MPKANNNHTPFSAAPLSSAAATLPDNVVGSRADWVGQAAADYPILFFAAAALAKDKQQTLEMILAAGPVAMLEFTAALRDASDRYMALACLLHEGHARLTTASAQAIARRTARLS